MKKRYTEEQIIVFLKVAESGIPVKALCRKHGYSDGSFYTWRSNYGGMEVSEAKRLKALEEENARLKKLLADTLLDKEALAVALKKSTDPSSKTSSSKMMYSPETFVPVYNAISYWYLFSSEIGWHNVYYYCQR